MKKYFIDYGYSPDEIEVKVNKCFETMFEGMDRFYFEGLKDTGYLMDTGNCDARTEGISYGMMICALMNKKEYFDRLWKFAMTFMYMDEGPLRGYFAWSVAPDGRKNAFGPAPDGEEFFAMALILASQKWGDAEGIFNYSFWARKILHTMLHHDVPMWDKKTALILFVPGCPFSDPSYHLMHFYKRFADWCDPCDREFWLKAAEESRKFLLKACHPVTGLNPEYANLDGTPKTVGPDKEHGDFYSDAYRTAANIAVDCINSDAIDGTYELSSVADNIIRFFADKKPEDYMKYEIDGTATKQKALHPIGLLSTLAQATLASTHSVASEAEKLVRLFWETPMRKGERRYYDNCLYMFAVLALSGKYKI